MKLKKLTALMLAGVMALSLVACGNKDAATEETTTDTTTTAEPTDTAEPDDTAEPVTDLEGKLVVWTLANDLVSFADKFMETYPNVEVESVVIAPADYPTKVQSALLGGEVEPDIIVGEPQMLEAMYDAGFFANLDEFGAQDYASNVVDYIWKVGQDADGIQRAISYQITPAAFFYRMDIAEEVFGTSDQAAIGELFSSYDKIIETGNTLKAAGYRIFASDADVTYFSGDSAWVIDGKLNVDSDRYAYMELVNELYNQDLTAYAAQWTAPWYQAMAGPVPVLSKELMWGDWGENEEGVTNLNVWDAENFNANIGNYDTETSEVFAFGLPSWGVLTMRDNVGELSGKYGVCGGPKAGFSGGTFIGISDLSERKELAWEFVKFCTLTESTMEWWIEFSEGDTVSYIPTLEKHKDDTNPVYGNQPLYKLFLDLAEGIDYSKVTKYDKAIGDAWGAAIDAYKTGEKSKDDAVAEFYDVVAATYPELEIER